MSNPNLRAFGVLAGAYPTAKQDQTFLYHACEVNAEGFPIRVLCNKVKLENINEDPTVSRAVDMTTCTVCAKRAAKE